MTGAQREQQGLAFSCMLATAVRACSADGLCISYEFRRHSSFVLGPKMLASFLDSKLNVLDMVVVSSEDGRYLACASGVLLLVESDRIIVGLEAPLRIAETQQDTSTRTIAEASQSHHYPSIPLRIDKDTLSSEQKSVRGSLASLFIDKTEPKDSPESCELQRRRLELLIDLKAPKFAPVASLAGTILL
jgi:hypothetical protein